MGSLTLNTSPAAADIDFTAIKARQQRRLGLGRLRRGRHDASDRRRELCEALDLAPARTCWTWLPETAMPRSPPRAAGRRYLDGLCAGPAGARQGPRRGRGPERRLPDRGCRGPALRGRQASTPSLSTFGVMFTPNQERRPARCCACAARRADRPCQLDARGLHRPAVQDDRQACAAGTRAASRRRCGARSLGLVALFGPGARMTRPRSGSSISATVAGALAGGLQDLVRPGPQGLCRTRPARTGRAKHDLLALIARFDTSNSPDIVVPGTYLEVIVRKF